MTTTPLAISLAALGTFVIGLYLGHRWGSHDARVEANDQKRRTQRILQFAAPYIEAHADSLDWRVDRNDAGEILDMHAPPIRCGTYKRGTPHLDDMMQDRKSRD